MLQFLKNIFGSKKVDFNGLMKNGAQIIDVRTPSEFENGHIPRSQNIPLQFLNQNIDKINQNKPVITCCASGIRSASAKSMLVESGFEAYNGGGWKSLQEKL